MKFKCTTKPDLNGTIKFIEPFKFLLDGPLFNCKSPNVNSILYLPNVEHGRSAAFLRPTNTTSTLI